MPSPSQELRRDPGARGEQPAVTPSGAAAGSSRPQVVANSSEQFPTFGLMPGGVPGPTGPFPAG